MKIAFITSSLASGRDGVGDYTKGFADELQQLGHDVFVIAIRDKFINETISSERQIKNGSIQTLRLPSALPWPECLQLAKQQLDHFNPDWVSLQFVSYTFHPKGLVHGLAERLAPLIAGRKLHLMFHELWGGAQQGARIKERLIGFAQKYFITSFINRAKPSKVHTSNLAYQFLLQKCGVDAGVLPLFGNIPIVESSSDWMEAELNKIGVTPFNRKKFCVLGIFGNIPSEWTAENFLKAVVEVVAKTERQLLLLTIGAHSVEAEKHLLEAAQKFSGQVKVVNFGNQSPERLSEFFQTLDFGVATAPWCLLGKSGAVAAMLEHGLPVLVFRNDVNLNVAEPGNPQFIKMEGGWERKMQETPKLKPRRNRPEIVRTFLRDLHIAEASKSSGLTK